MNSFLFDIILPLGIVVSIIGNFYLANKAIDTYKETHKNKKGE